MAHQAQSPTPERVVLRPRRVRLVCWLLAPAVVAAFVLLANGLTGPTGSGTAVFQPSDRLAMIGLGLLAGAAILVFTRPRVIADRTGVKVRNVLSGYELPWQVVRSVQFGRGHPWASLELQDDDMVAVMAIQAADKEYAVAGVRALRRLLAAHGGNTGHNAAAGGGPVAGGSPAPSETLTGNSDPPRPPGDPDTRPDAGGTVAGDAGTVAGDAGGFGGGGRPGDTSSGRRA